jgi:ribose 5-phosphate isomerase B
MRIAFAADDENPTTQAVQHYLTTAGHNVIHPATETAAWPQIGAAVGHAVAAGQADLGIVMCWTGTGTAIAANKVPGIRAAQAWEPWIAEGARKWNDANVLSLSLKRLAPDVAVDITRAFLAVDAPDPDEAENISSLER